jgi:phage anti-repressor protein
MFTNDSRFALVPASVKTAITTALQAEQDTYVLREVYEWLGYTRYDNAVAAFRGAGFSEGLDYTEVLLISQENPGGRPRKDLTLTTDCFKAFAMQARTEQGKQVRLYFIECERQLEKVMQQALSRTLTKLEQMELANEALAKQIDCYPSYVWDALETFVNRQYNKRRS